MTNIHYLVKKKNPLNYMNNLCDYAHGAVQVGWEAPRPHLRGRVSWRLVQRRGQGRAEDLRGSLPRRRLLRLLLQRHRGFTRPRPQTGRMWPTQGLGYFGEGEPMGYRYIYNHLWRRILYNEMDNDMKNRK